MSTELHKQFGFEYVTAAFELWCEEHDIDLQYVSTEQRNQYFRMFNSAFNHGVTAHANGNYY